MILADVKWIKLTVDMFDNRKIKHLRRLPNGDCIVLIWVMLLTLAGRCNARGMVFLTEDIPYTPKMLANEFGLDESTVVLALKSFEELGMVSTTDNSFLLVNGWEKYQNVDGMEKIREQTRNRVAKHREKQKLLPGNVTGNVTVTQCNETEEDKNKSKSRNKNKESEADKPPARHRFIPPTVNDVRAYCKDCGYSIDPERFVDFYTSNGWRVGKNPMRDWKAKVREWASRESQEKPATVAEEFPDGCPWTVV